jgi:hypothetical protein
VKVKRLAKKGVSKEIERVPEDHLRDVLAFVDHVLKTKWKAKRTKLTSHKDPILDFSG